MDIFRVIVEGWGGRSPWDKCSFARCDAKTIIVASPLEGSVNRYYYKIARLACTEVEFGYLRTGFVILREALSDCRRTLREP